MFELVHDENGRPLYWVYNPNLRSEKNHDGGIRNFRSIRGTTHIEFFHDGRPERQNPELIFQRYYDAMPKNYVKPELDNPLFPKPLGDSRGPNLSIIFSNKAVRGRN